MAKSWFLNKDVIVTGATSGIGRELVEILLENFHCRVVGVSRNAEKASLVYSEIKERFNGYFKYCFDVSDKDGWKAFSDYLDDIDFKPDLVINNAGILPTFRSVEKITMEDYEKVLGVDFLSCVYSFKTLCSKGKSGSYPAFVNVSSSAALASLAGTSAYTAAKSALRGFTECITYELKDKTYVGLVMPGFTKTNIFRNQNQSIDEGIIGKISTPANKMARKIIRGIQKKKKRMIFGKDAHFMSFLARIMPQKSTNLTSFVLKKSKMKLFNEVFFD